MRHRATVARCCAVALAIAGAPSCASRATAPEASAAGGVTAAPVSRAALDSADRDGWRERRDLHAGRLDRGGVAEWLEAARASRSLALALGAPEERGRELARAESWARGALRAAPEDAAARYLVARLLLDRHRVGAVGGEVLAEARQLLASVVAADRTFGSGAALEALAETYALAGVGRADSPELERAAQFFEAALDVDAQLASAHLEYAERVLWPWHDRTTATEHLRACAAALLVPAADATRFADDDRAQRRCVELLQSTDATSGTALR